ncbi:cysteine hydrolase family protein [Phytohabitans sp. ZYX-F-186]|uniref:Cysteine hydrolase family protein n=1 Tax=Phytohabitans maris TaxID=3071409 RepID=A0ABU0ZGZ3_9ACTN|nr:cysteine hydrolase family protein [Phytohabitans sp. ZYX-F-186]MDQ7906263.1 cysteine hydrolase family protein [Phytohabitans sp. ZYX-F-186]
MRGGYLPPDGFDLSAAAVLLVDMTNDFGHPDGAYARHGASCEPLTAIVPAVARLTTAAQTAGRPVVLCSQYVLTGADGRAVAAAGLVAARPWLLEEGLRRDTWGTRQLADLPPADFVVDKPRASGFFATPLDLLLRDLGVNTVVVVGGFTNQCVAATVRDAWALDYTVVLPPDGSACFDPALHDATLESLRPLTAQPTVATLVEAWSTPR